MIVASGSTHALTTPQVVVGLACGLGLFLLGLEQLTASMRVLAGPRLKRWVATLTRNRLSGAATGAAAAATLQSSSATSVIVIGLVSAGALSLEQSIGVLMGANVGTTITAQLLAFDLATLAAILSLGGLGFALLGPRGPVRHAGAAAFGLGVLFAGMELMRSSAAPLRHHETVAEALASASNPLLAILLGAIVTALLQSSSATIGLVMVLAAQGLVTLEASLALLYGANLGTCATGFLAALGKPRSALRVALAHLIFNLLGVLIWLPLLQPLAELARTVSPSAPAGLPEAMRVADDLPRQVANAHLIFNLGTTLLLLGFTPVLAQIVYRLVPERRPRVVD